MSTHLLIRSDTEKLGLPVKTLKHIRRTWLFHYYKSLSANFMQQENGSFTNQVYYLRSIVKIIFSLELILFKLSFTSHNILKILIKSFKFNLNTKIIF